MTTQNDPPQARQPGEYGHLNSPKVTLPRPAGYTPHAPMTKTQKKRAKLLAASLGGPVMFLLGLILTGVTSGTVSVCNSTLGQFGQALDQQAAAKCATANTVSSVDTWMIWLGLLITVGGAAGLYFTAQEAKRAAAAAAAKAPVTPTDTP